MKMHGKERLNEYVESLHGRTSDVITDFVSGTHVKECGIESVSPLCFMRNGKYGKKHVNLKPGECIVSDDDIIVSTILGSCISVCFYSDASPCFGMNHFLLPQSKNEPLREEDILHSASGYYGINAMELVINAMLRAGVGRNGVKAKVFGGGNVLRINSASKSVGEQNVDFALRFLELENIPVTACSLGGDYARKIIYFQHSHDVLMQRLSHTRDMQIAQEEELLYRSGAQQSGVEFFK